MFQPPDTFMKPIVKPAVDSASAMRLTLPISDKLGAEVHLTCLSTIPGFMGDKDVYVTYADYRSSYVVGKYGNDTRNIITIIVISRVRRILYIFDG